MSFATRSCRLTLAEESCEAVSAPSRPSDVYCIVRLNGSAARSSRSRHPYLPPPVIGAKT